MHSVWVPEVGGKEAFATLGYVASRTSRVRLGPGVANIYTRTPTLVTMEAATLDWLSGGRAILGLGSSTKQVIEQWHGLQFGRPLERMREFIDVVRLGLKGSKVNYNGKIFRIPNFKLAIEPVRPSVPIFLAALNNLMVKLGAEIADGILLNLHPLSLVGKTVKTVEQVRERAGSDTFAKVAVLMTNFTADRKVSEERMRRNIAFYVAGKGPYATMLRRAGLGSSVSRVQNGWEEGGMSAASRKVDEELLTGLPVATDTEELISKVRRLEGDGIDVVTLQLHFEGVDPEKTLRETLSRIIS